MLHRYYLEDGKKNPVADVVALSATLHALYTHWVRAGAHQRDFTVAAAHAADGVYFEYLLGHSPTVTPEMLASAPVCTIALAVPRKGPLTHPAHRFYDEVNGLNPDIDTSQHHPALVPHFLQWTANGMAPRDFTQAVRDAAESIIYDHGICESMGGLGGGKTGLQFLTTPYKV